MFHSYSCSTNDRNSTASEVYESWMRRWRKKSAELKADRDADPSKRLRLAGFMFRSLKIFSHKENSDPPTPLRASTVGKACGSLCEYWKHILFVQHSVFMDRSGITFEPFSSRATLPAAWCPQRETFGDETSLIAVSHRITADVEPNPEIRIHQASEDWKVYETSTAESQNSTWSFTANDTRSLSRG